jgi:glycosyltransferase involved in cell wall biosynthesis
VSTASGVARLLFAAYMAGGNATILQNLQDFIQGREDVDSAWLPVEMDAESKRLGQAPKRHWVPGTIRNSLLAGNRIHELERSHGRFDAAYFFQQTICMFLWGFRARVPYVVAMDGTPLWYARNELWYAQVRFDPRSPAARVKHALTREVYRHAFHLLPLSWSVRDSLIREYDVPADRITVVPPGINLRRYACPDRQAQAARAGPLNVLFVGADFKRKGGDLLVEIARMPEFRDVHFHLVTRSYQGPGADNLHVHDAIQSNSEPMLQLLRAADLYVLPTRADSHAIASLEAMAMGLPVVTTPVGGVPDIMEEGKTGFLVPRDDLGALLDRIRQLRDDPGLRVTMGQAARRRVEQHFDADAVAATVVDIMKRAAASRA